MEDPHTEAHPAFHVGERAIQARFGLEQKLAQTGARPIRPFMPDQHREFFAHLSYVVIGAADAAGRLWASLLLGAPGCITSPGPQLLHIDALPSPSDPLAGALGPGMPVGVLGIELATRRRNRANGRVLSAAGERPLRIEVEQSFGNCPQYIWPREPDAGGDDARAAQPPLSLALGDARIRRFLRQADTFFIASQYRDPDSGALGGVDVSHRGGAAGFVHDEDGVLAWPEYRGNFYFNTLGNLTLNPACGLLLADFTRGDLLHLTGSAELHFAEHGELPKDGLLRVNCLVRFTPTQAVLCPGALPGSWRLLGAAHVAARAL